jgi:hypothetical protein
VRRDLGHAHHLRGVTDLDGQRLRVQPDDLAIDGGTVTHEADRRAELPDGRDRALDDDPGPVIASHRVHRDLHDGGVGPDYAPSTATISRPL